MLIRYLRDSDNPMHHRLALRLENLGVSAWRLRPWGEGSVTDVVQARPASDIQKLLTERIVQIAAEGRKYGLWLLLSTQRPSKVHPNALSQCDNLALMRRSSSRDLDELASVFGFAPTSLVQRSRSFSQGQSLFAGGFVDTPSLVQMGARLTYEGGSDVSVPLRNEDEDPAR